jgi:hypothetical protein
MSAVYKRMKKLGVRMDSHESDLYVPVTPETTEAIEELTDSGAMTVEVTRFRSHDGTEWYDIPFAFDPWWQERGMST